MSRLLHSLRRDRMGMPEEEILPAGTCTAIRARFEDDIGGTSLPASIKIQAGAVRWGQAERRVRKYGRWQT
jgi:hypothetical protein